MKTTPNELLTQLRNFTGTEHLYRHWLGYHYTDGVFHLAESAGAHWLLDAIGSYQATRRIRDDTMLREFQVWELHVNLKNHSADLRCLRDTDDLVFHQHIPFTDFPLSQIKLYLRDGILLLPSEY